MAYNVVLQSAIAALAAAGYRASPAPDPPSSGDRVSGTGGGLGENDQRILLGANDSVRGSLLAVRDESYADRTGAIRRRRLGAILNDYYREAT